MQSSRGAYRPSGSMSPPSRHLRQVHRSSASAGSIPGIAAVDLRISSIGRPGRALWIAGAPHGAQPTLEAFEHLGVKGLVHCTATGSASSSVRPLTLGSRGSFPRHEGPVLGCSDARRTPVGISSRGRAHSLPKTAGYSAGTVNWRCVLASIDTEFEDIRRKQLVGVPCPGAVGVGHPDAPIDEIDPCQH